MSSLQEIIHILARMEQGKNCEHETEATGRELPCASGQESGKRGEGAPWDRLTDREKQAVELLMTGASNRIIAKRMGLSERTIKNHLQSAYRKLRVHSRSEAILKLLGPADRRRAPAPPGPGERAGSPSPPPDGV